jgi:hypothetical protein
LSKKFGNADALDLYQLAANILEAGTDRAHASRSNNSADRETPGCISSCAPNCRAATAVLDMVKTITNSSNLGGQGNAKEQPITDQNLMSHFDECTCNFCGTAVRFEISKAGELVNCESCGMGTILFTPGSEPPYPVENFFLKVANMRWSKNPLGFRNILGEIVNTSHKDLDWIRIEFELVNRETVRLGTASDCLRITGGVAGAAHHQYANDLH